VTQFHPAVTALSEKLGDDYDVEISFGTHGEDTIVKLSCYTKNRPMKRYTIQRILTELVLSHNEFAMDFAIRRMYEELAEVISDEC